MRTLFELKLKCSFTDLLPSVSIYRQIMCPYCWVTPALNDGILQIKITGRQKISRAMGMFAIYF
jgi:hypothetical protein